MGKTDPRLALIERKLDLILEHLGIRAEFDDFEPVRAAIRHGNTIDAIKLYRQITGCDLKTAKNAVDSGRL